MRTGATLICVGLAACSQAAIDLPPDAVVSTSLCADGYVQAFPELETRLAALSWQSRSALSLTPDRLKLLTQTDANPERAVMWNGATRISSAGEGGDLDLKWGEDFETVWENLESLSAALNLTNPADNLKSRLAALETPTTRPKILYLNRSGGTAGPGTFVDAVIRAAGADNIIKSPGWQSPDTETLIELDPDIILTSFMDSNYAGINDRAIRHDALAAKIQTVPTIDIPGKYWPCAGPGLVEAAEQLSQQLSAL